MYDVTVLDTKTKQLVNHFNLDKFDVIALVNICLKSHYLNSWVTNFQQEKVKGYDFICGLERG